MERRKPERKVIVLKPPEQRSGFSVTQRDLEELLFFERQMRDAAMLWQIKRDTIRRYLELGGKVEPGLREAHLNSYVRDANSDHPRSSMKLVVK